MDNEETQAYLVRMRESFAERAAEALAVMADEDASDDAQDEARESLDVYAVERRTVLSFMLAGGGPTAWLHVTRDGDGDVTRVEWVGTWAGPDVRHEERQGSPLWQWGEYMAEGVE